MKKIKFILNGFMALAFGLMFAQCAGNNNAASVSAPAAGAAGSGSFLAVFLYCLLHAGKGQGSQNGI